MSNSSRAVVITGMGSVSSVGHDCQDLLAALERGDSGIRPIGRFDTAGFSVHLGAEAKAAPNEATVATSLTDVERCAELARRAAGEAVRSAGLDGSGVAPDRIGIVLGTGLSEVDHAIHELTVELADELGIQGPRLTVCTACSSSTAAIGIARDLLVAGSCDVVLGGGADVLTERIFAGFHALGVLSPERCAPFSSPFGTTLGEGAGFLVMERPEHAAARGVEAVGWVSGYGLSADGHHETSPDPRGAGVERAVKAALADAGLRGADVGYVNCHGSGTAANDPSEWRGIQRGLGDAALPAVSSSKGALGHAQGAAGVLETIVTLLSMRRGLVPPTLNFVGPRAFVPEDPVAGPRPRAHDYTHALCLNSAFGGSNAAVVVSRRAPGEALPRGRAPVSIVGVGLVSRHGLGVEAWQNRRQAGSSRVPDFDFAEVSRRIDPRGLDTMSRHLTAASALALADAGRTVRSGRPDRSGLVMGATRPSPESLGRFGDSIEAHGLDGLSAPAFARVVLNASAGFCSKLLGLKGPLTVLTTGAGSGLAAIVLAAELLGSRDDVDVMLAGGVDELTDEEAEEGRAAAGEGAAVVALSRQAPDEGPVPRLVSWGVAGPRQSGAAVAQALRAADAEPLPEECVFDEGCFGGSTGVQWALPSALAFVAAVGALRAGTIPRALVTSSLGSAVSVAALLEI